MRDYTYEVEMIERKARGILANHSIPSADREELARAYLSFLPVIYLNDQYLKMMRDIFNVAHNNDNIEDFEGFCENVVDGFYNEFREAISVAYKNAVKELNTALKHLEGVSTYIKHSVYDDSHDIFSTLNETLQWQYNHAIGEVFVLGGTVYNLDADTTFAHCAEEQGFYPSKDE